MGFGKGSAGTAGNGFQLLMVIFVELFGVSLGQMIGALSPTIQAGDFLMLCFVLLNKFRLFLDRCVIQSVPWVGPYYLCGRDHSIPHDVIVLAVVALSIDSIHARARCYVVDGITVRGLIFLQARCR